MPELDNVDRLLLSEACDTGSPPDLVVVVDAPALANHLAESGTRVVAWCDNITNQSQLSSDAAVSPDWLCAEDAVGAPPLTAALYRLPKSLGELDEVAGAIARRCGPTVRLLAGARIKHLNHSMTSVIGRHFDATSASLGVAKARVLRGVGANPLPNPWPKSRRQADLDVWLSAHGGTFSGYKLDPGTALLAEHLPRLPEGPIVDFGSGNGVLSVLLAGRGHQVTAIDSSWAGVAATRESAALNQVEVEVCWADGLSGQPDGSAAAIVSNPPFHQGRAKESSPTLDMFREASRVLAPSGEFWCVFNSHLPWRRELTAHLGPTKVVAQDRHYTVTRSRRAAS